MRILFFLCTSIALHISTAFAEQGSFFVFARNPFGASFTNSGPSPITIQFSATGTWDWKLNSNTSPIGEPRLCGDHGSCPMNDQNIGALVVKKGPNYYYVGESIELMLRVKETIYFSMNDALDYYIDNKGSLKIQWICLVNCNF